MQRIVVSGGTGFIGRALVAQLLERGCEVVVVSRSPGPTHIGWGEESLMGALGGSAGVVNLAGASVGRRWTGRHRQRILQSRLETTEALVRAIEKLPAAERPPVFVSASGIDYAGNTGETVVTEDSPRGDSFLARVCGEWEAAASAAETFGVRVVRMRTPFVIGRDAPALRLMALPFRMLAGGRLGNGRQWFPWIHLADAASIYARALTDSSLDGAVNVVATERVRQSDFARALGAALRRPAVMPAPAAALRLVLGRQADLLLHGQRAVSEKLDGHAFAYPRLLPALEEALG